MKKIIFVALAALSTNAAVAGAWYSKEINAILAKMPSKYYTKVDATLWGAFGNGIWEPPHAIYDYTTGMFIVNNADSFNVTSYSELNNYGMYDAEASSENFFCNIGSIITDEFGNEYTLYDDSVIAFYLKYENMNFEEAKRAFDSLDSAFVMWKNDAVSSTTTLETDVSKIAEMTKEIEQKLGDAKEEIANAVKETEKISQKLNNELKEVQENLTKISEEAVYNAQKKIESTVTDFNSFVVKLENAIEREDWDGTAFESAFDELTKSEQDLIDAITELQKSPDSPEVQQAIAVLNGQLVDVRSLKASLRTAITNKDKIAALEVLNSSKSKSFYDSRKSIANLSNKIKELKSKEKALEMLTNAALATMNEQDDFASSIDKMRSAFSTMFITSMDNFHQINAYLGSTNSIAYLDKREGVEEECSLDDFTVDELIRWIKISVPQRIDDDYGFGLCMLGGKRRHFIWDTLASTYGMYAWPYDDGGNHGWEKFMDTYNLTGASPRYNGFYQEPTPPGGTMNWYAKNITAPFNWADGTSIVVTNGVFSAKAGAAIEIVGTENNQQGVKSVVLGSGATTNKLTFASASDSNVKVTVSGDAKNVTVTLGVYYQ